VTLRRFGKLLAICLAVAFLLVNISGLQAKEKGPALQQLESTAGKKIEDVKVPEPPKPTPVQVHTPTTPKKQSSQPSTTKKR
jgi:hypothetical protein